MFKSCGVIVGLMALCLGAAAWGASPSTQPAWQSPYGGEAATGDSIIGLWHFDADGPTKDASGHKHAAQLQKIGSSFVKEGKFGGALRIELDKTVQDKLHGVSIPNSDSLTPKGAFSIEMWFQPDERLADLKTAYLLDKKGFPYKSDHKHANDGYMLLLRRARGGQFNIEAQLGYGKDSDILRSRPVDLKAGQWYHVGFSYDGKGKSRLSLDGKEIGRFDKPGRGAISHGIYPLVIGDRALSIHAPFSGKIDEVRLTNRAIHFGTDTVMLSAHVSRTAFYRMEKDAKLRFEILNDTPETADGVSLVLSGKGIGDRVVKVPALKSQQQRLVEIPIDTKLQIGRYAMQVVLQGADHQPMGEAQTVEVTIVPRDIPHTMPVLMWGTPNSLQDLKDIGYNYYIKGVPNLFPETWTAGKAQDLRDLPSYQQLRQAIDQSTAMGLHVAATISPGRWAGRTQKKYDRINRKGKPYGRENICGQFQVIQDFVRNVGATVAQSLGDMPGLGATLIHTEVRDGTDLCFHDLDKEAYKKFSGQEIPANVNSKRGVLYHSLKDFPASRIIPDDDPILSYLKWFWKQGDAWNQLDTLTSEGIHSTGRKDLWTWFDPAIRVPSVWGSGGKVDVISQWTYSYPNPIKIGLAADDLLAMAQGRPGQKVMNMIQIIWYRSQTAPAPKKGEKPIPNQAEWEKKLPDARFISIAPDHLSEGMWLELARPIKGIMNHGWGSIGAEVGYHQGSYVTTNAETRKRMTRMMHEVVQPLGPTLMQVPDRKADVAYLQSFASQMFAGRGTYGWGGGWGADAYMVIRYAALQPQIVYDETIEKYGLDQYKVLVLADCDVLPQGVAEAIRKFQNRGGLVIGDENLAPGIQPDIVLQSYKRTGKPDKDKAALQQLAKKLTQDLGGFYAPAARSDNPDVLVRLRQYDDSDYFFAVNDHRTFGDYVGQHGIVMEKGLPSKTTLTLHREDGHVYDLTEHKAVGNVQKRGGELTFPSDFGPGQGRLFLVTDRPIGGVEVKTPDSGKAGGSAACQVTVVDDAGKAIDAVVPVKIQITDPHGKAVEYSGYYGAKDGKVELKLDLPTNAAAGTWTVKATELASGRSAQAGFKVE